MDKSVIRSVEISNLQIWKVENVDINISKLPFSKFADFLIFKFSNASLSFDGAHCLINDSVVSILLLIPRKISRRLQNSKGIFDFIFTRKIYSFRIA